MHRFCVASGLCPDRVTSATGVWPVQLHRRGDMAVALTVVVLRLLLLKCFVLGLSGANENSAWY